MNNHSNKFSPNALTERKRKALPIVIDVVEKKRKKKLTKPCLLLFGADKQLTATNGDVNRTESCKSPGNFSEKEVRDKTSLTNSLRPKRADLPATTTTTKVIPEIMKS